MATSSNTKHFVISGKEQVEMFVNAIEESAKSVTPEPSVQVTELRGEKEIREFLERRKKANEWFESIFDIQYSRILREGKKLGENDLQQILSEFTCPKNPDVEKFLKQSSIEFTKKNQSVTYLVFSYVTTELVGYFTLTIKPKEVNSNSNISKSVMKKVARMSEGSENSNSFNLAAY